MCGHKLRTSEAKLADPLLSDYPIDSALQSRETELSIDQGSQSPSLATTPSGPKRKLAEERRTPAKKGTSSQPRGQTAGPKQGIPRIPPPDFTRGLRPQPMANVNNYVVDTMQDDPQPTIPSDGGVGGSRWASGASEPSENAHRKLKKTAITPSIPVSAPGPLERSPITLDGTTIWENVAEGWIKDGREFIGTSGAIGIIVVDPLAEGRSQDQTFEQAGELFNKAFPPKKDDPIRDIAFPNAATKDKHKRPVWMVINGLTEHVIESALYYRALTTASLSIIFFDIYRADTNFRGVFEKFTYGPEASDVLHQKLREGMDKVEYLKIASASYAHEQGRGHKIDKVFEELKMAAKLEYVGHTGYNGKPKHRWSLFLPKLVGKQYLSDFPQYLKMINVSSLRGGSTLNAPKRCTYCWDLQHPREFCPLPRRKDWQDKAAIDEYKKAEERATKERKRIAAGLPQASKKYKAKGGLNRGKGLGGYKNRG